MPRAHPRNHGFTWQSPRGPYEVVTPEQARQYDEEGYFLLEGAFEPEELRVVAEAIAPHEAEAEARLREQVGGREFIAKADAITFTVHLTARSEVLRDFARHDVFRGLCRDLLGTRDARLYWDQAVYKRPGNPEEFPWHQDNGYKYVEPQQYLTCWVPLVDATTGNGCPWVVPGAHRSGTLAHELTELGWQCLEAPEDAVAVEARRGDVVVFSSLTPHRTGPNLTDGVRKSYILQYAPNGAVGYELGVEEPQAQDDPDWQFKVEG